MRVFFTASQDETIQKGRELSKELLPNSVVCFFGDLGAGKTTFIKGVVEGATGTSTSQVSSPTFVYMTQYEGIQTVYHFDLYRLKDADEFLSMGFHEYFFAGAICCVEWSERIESLLPPNRYNVTIEHQGVDKRKIVIS